MKLKSLLLIFTFIFTSVQMMLACDFSEPTLNSFKVFEDAMGNPISYEISIDVTLGVGPTAADDDTENIYITLPVDADITSFTPALIATPYIDCDGNNCYDMTGSTHSGMSSTKQNVLGFETPAVDNMFAWYDNEFVDIQLSYTVVIQFTSTTDPTGKDIYTHGQEALDYTSWGADSERGVDIPNPLTWAVSTPGGTGSTCDSNCGAATAYCVHQRILPSPTIEVLPVELTSFTARTNNENVDLNWETASELNSQSFQIEKSNNGEDFKMIGEVRSAGTTAETQYYNFTDNNPSKGTNYYRLKQVDFDGTFEYTKIINIEFYNQGFEFTIKPNPASDFINVQLVSNERSDYRIELIGMDGRVVRTFSEELNLLNENLRLNLTSISSGIYFLKINNVKQVTTQKLMIK